MTLPLDPVVARRTWRTLEPLHSLIYFAPEAAERYATLGLAGPSGYFASRAAAMGPVNAEVVIATFYNFHPGLVRTSMAGVWDATTPGDVLAARMEAADGALRGALGDAVGSQELGRAAILARVAAEVAGERPEGRPLFAGHAALPWPDEDHLALWHAQTLLREFRGDGHIAALTVAGLSGLEALVLHAATGEIPVRGLRATRAWPDDAWDEAVESLRSRGWLTSEAELQLSAAGAAHRQEVEDRTDALALHPYAALGEERCTELRSLARPLSRAVVASGMIGLAQPGD
ncbi:MAG TPA: hypothetical protein VFP54_03680 [Acidimicrobiales bacterium]|nr:hypothetical protein [Acidimicrobiales bacterium]